MLTTRASNGVCIKNRGKVCLFNAQVFRSTTALWITLSVSKSASKSVSSSVTNSHFFWKPFMSVQSVFKSHVCAAFWHVALRNNSFKELETHIADRKRLKIVPGTIYCFIVYNFCYFIIKKKTIKDVFHSLFSQSTMYNCLPGIVRLL